MPLMSGMGIGIAEGVIKEILFPATLVSFSIEGISLFCANKLTQKEIAAQGWKKTGIKVAKYFLVSIAALSAIFSTLALTVSIGALTEIYVTTKLLPYLLALAILTASLVGHLKIFKFALNPN